MRGINCPDCGVLKTIENTNTKKIGGFLSYCKKCYNKRSYITYRLAHPKHINYELSYYQRNKQKVSQKRKEKVLLETKHPLWIARQKEIVKSLGEYYNVTSFNDLMESILSKANKNGYKVEIQICEENSGFII